MMAKPVKRIPNTRKSIDTANTFLADSRKLLWFLSSFGVKILMFIWFLFGYYLRPFMGYFLWVLWGTFLMRMRVLKYELAPLLSPSKPQRTHREYLWFCDSPYWMSTAETLLSYKWLNLFETISRFWGGSMVVSSYLTVCLGSLVILKLGMTHPLNPPHRNEKPNSL